MPSPVHPKSIEAMQLQYFANVVTLIITLSTRLIPANAKPSNHLEFMVVGDSISHGFEGDFTWRYRLWEWFRDQHIKATFVGPYNGTYPQSKGAGPICKKTARRAITKLPIPAYPFGAAGYAEDVVQNWPNAHYSLRGQLAARTKLKGVTAQFHPDYILMELGMDDLIFKRHPDDILGDIKRLVEEARAAKPEMRFAIATIPNMEQLAGMPYSLPGWTDELNENLEYEIKKWSTPASPVTIVRLREAYDCIPNGCPVAWDGVHPAELGEYQIAGAFSRALHEDFGLGMSPLEVPAEGDIVERPKPIPANFEVEAVPWGIKLTWDKIIGTHRYEVNRRQLNTADWQTSYSGNGHEYGANRYDAMDVADGEKWEFRVRVNNGDVLGVLRVSDWTTIKSAVAHPTTDACGRELKHSGLAGVHWILGMKPIFVLSVAFFIISATVYELLRRLLGRPLPVRT